MMETVDSKKQKLSLQEVIVRSLHAQEKQLDRPVDQALLLITQEVDMPGAEAIQFGNTVFISHYAKESPLCAMYALNVDTAKNYIHNGELYVRHLMKRGIQGFVTSYQTESFGVPFRQIQKNKLGIVETVKTGKRFTTVVKLTATKPRKPDNV